MGENYGSLEGTIDAYDNLDGEIDNHAEILGGEIQFGSGSSSGVDDVRVNGVSVVANKIADIDLRPYAEKEDVYDKDAVDTLLEGKADTSDIPTALSQLENDDNYVQDADYVHTDNNFTDEDKAAIDNIPENITDLSDVEVSNIQNGQVLKWDATQEKFVNADESGGGGDVTDVKVDGTSVVDPVTGEADIDLSGKADKALDAVAGNFAVLLANGNYANSGKSTNDMASKAEMSVNTSGTQTTVQLKNGTSATINNPTITIQKNGQNVDTFTLNQTTNKVIDISVPTKTSDLQNDSSFITNTVDNLANYYLKSQTYTQTEVDALIDAAINGRFQKVNVLPATGEPNVIYLVPKATPETSNACDEYIWQDNAWELIGSTDIDLSGYVTDDELNTALADYLTTSAFNTAIANYYTKTEVGNLLDGKVDKISGKGLSTNDYDNTAKGIVDGVTAALADKVDKETGKGLSTNDYTTNDKNKLAGIAAGATKTASSTTNGNIKINDVETQVYDDSEIQNKIDETITSISGNPISISGLKANQLAKNPIITFEPIQAGSGTPSPSNIRAISGYDKIEVLSCGKNIWDGTYDATIGVGQFLTESNTLSPSGGWVVTNYIRVNGNKSYTISGTTSSGNAPAVCWYDKNLNYINGSRYVNATAKTISLPNNAAFIRFSIYNGVFGSTQLEESTSATTYVPYHKTTDLSESLGQTVYGATWYPRTGKLLVDRAIIDLGNLTWNKQSYGFIATISSMLSGRNATEYADNPMVTCSMFATAESLMAEIQNTIRPTYSGTTGLSTATIVAFNTSYTDGNAFKTAVTGQKLVYPLATPFEIQLTPHEISLLKDYAYVSTNGTNIALDYHNGELASLADVSQLGETVNELGEYVGRNEYFTTIALDDRVGSSSKYEFPYDGYIYISSETVTTGSIRVIITAYNSTQNIAYLYMNITSAYERQSLFVKKGMCLYLQAAIPSGTRVRYIPFM